MIVVEMLVNVEEALVMFNIVMKFRKLAVRFIYFCLIKRAKNVKILL